MSKFPSGAWVLDEFNTFSDWHDTLAELPRTRLLAEIRLRLKEIDFKFAEVNDTREPDDEFSGEEDTADDEYVPTPVKAEPSIRVMRAEPPRTQTEIAAGTILNVSPVRALMCSRVVVH